MFGLGLVLLGTFSEEISTSIGKKAVAKRTESTYALGFLTLFYGSVALILSVIFFGVSFKFSLASLPYFIPRMMTEFVAFTYSIKAVVMADRSTYSFLRLITIPLLLSVDIVLGYKLKSFQILGTLLIFGAIACIFATKKLNRRGSGYVLISALTAVITISLYKYDITHFNSVAAEQLVAYLILLTFFTVMGWYKRHEKTWAYLLKPLAEAQSLLQGLGMVIISFAYTLAPASAIVALQRGSALLWAIIFGNVYFHERHLFFKFLAYSLVIAGLVIIVI